MTKSIDFGRQFAAGVEATGNVAVDGKFDRVVFCGMGGSAIPGEMISLLWINSLNCYLNREYGLPHWVDKRCLVICVSWSGNTEETVSSFNEAMKRGLSVAAVADSGELLELAKKHSVPFVDLPSADLPARFVVGTMLSSILTLLNNSAIIDYSLPKAIENPAFGDNFSSRIRSKIPLIYSSYPWRYLARFWKIHFNENSKVHSFSNFLPEAAHNELAGFTPSKMNDFFPIILTDDEESPLDVKKLQKLFSFFKNQSIDHEMVAIEGNSRLNKIINNYNFAISVSTALANINNVEPFDTSIIEQFKKS